MWWESGFPWAPVQRWVLYQLQPLDALSPLVSDDWLEILDLERPCQCAYDWSAGAICSTCLTPWPCACGSYQRPDALRCRHCQRVRTPSRSKILDAALRGYHAAPFWVIQGQQGGHKLRYTTDEAQVAEELGLAKAPPEPGALPYAEWDRRVRANLIAYDLSRSRFRSMKTTRDEDRKILARQARQAQEQYLAGAFAEIQDETPDRIVDEVPRIHGARGVDEAEASARYIETGRT